LPNLMYLSIEPFMLIRIVISAKSIH